MDPRPGRAPRLSCVVKGSSFFSSLLPPPSTEPGRAGNKARAKCGVVGAGGKVGAKMGGGEGIVLPGPSKMNERAPGVLFFLAKK